MFWNWHGVGSGCNLWQTVAGQEEARGDTLRFIAVLLSFNLFSVKLKNVEFNY